MLSMLPRRSSALLLALMVMAAPAAGQPHGPAAADKPQPSQPQQDRPAEKSGVLMLLPPDAVSEKSLERGGRRLAYTATAGTLPLYNQSGEKSAAIFYTAYVARTTPGAPPRPLTFAFNGGPGAASAFLHLGLVGPKVVQFGDSGQDPAAARLVDNPDTWLAFTDLVLVDPVGTGWSRAAKPDGGQEFWGIDSDAESLAKFISLYVSRNGRIGTPIHILGESYGGFRAAKVAVALQKQQSLFVQGIVMMSPLLESAFLFGGKRLALNAALHLPSLAATELERTGRFGAAALAEAEHFAMNEYLTTLAGPPPTGEAARLFYEKVARISGLPVAVVARERGFVADAYVKHLIAGKVVSRYDASFAIDDPYPENEAPDGPDPVLDGIARTYGSMFVAYAREELGYRTDLTYNLLAGEVTRRWDWGRRRSPPGVSDDLRRLLSLTPSFRLLVAHGYSDLVTPYAASRYVLDHLPPVTGRDRAVLKLYRGGHMFYTDAGSRQAFTAAAQATIAAAPQ